MASTRTAPAAVFVARGATKVYRMGEVEVWALRGVDLELYEGEFVVLLGPSGSGKSTLLNILGGLDVPTSGRVSFRDHDLTAADDRALTRYRRQHVGFVFQFYNLIPSLTARENVALVTEIAADPMTPEAALDMEGAFNDLSVTLARGASEAEVVARLDRLLDRYGGRAFGRAEQPSHRYLASEIDQLRGNALIVPPIFLAVAAFLLNVVLARLVGTQRVQIATLKAFGYSSREVALHYLEFALAIVLAGAALGVAAGFWLGTALTAVYTEFFRFPVLAFRLDPRAVGLAVLVSVTASLAGAAGAVRRVAGLPPAEAMQPEAPAAFRPLILERLGLHRRLSQTARMVLRSLERRPLRSLLSVLAMALSVAILVVGGMSGDAVDFIVDTQFNRAQRDDVTVVFGDPEPSRGARSATRIGWRCGSSSGRRRTS